jgi:hypothetical protein
MAATKKKSTGRNDTPNTPQVNESDIGRMKVEALRSRLKDQGVKGTAQLKKPDLVKKLVKALVSETKPKKSSTSSAEKSAPASKTSTSASAKKSTSASGRTGRNDTPNTPAVNESEIARLKVDVLRRRLKDRGVQGTAKLKKPDLVKKLVKVYLADAKASPSAKKTTAAGKASATKASSKASGTKASATKGASAKTASTKATGSKAVGSKAAGAKKAAGSRARKTVTSTVRTGRKTSPSVKYSQEISSTSDRPERAGRSLVTTDHEVIRQWAEARKAVPSTVEGTDKGDHLGVLRFDFPGYGGDRLTPVSWEDWLGTFDKRRLNFIYQEKLANGKPSNFFQLESPDREDG